MTDFRTTSAAQETRITSLQSIVRKFFGPYGVIQRPIDDQVPSANLHDDLRLTELDRVKLVAAFETALHIQVSEPIVWQRSTTLESLYADVEKQLALQHKSLPRTSPDDDNDYRLYEQRLRTLTVQLCGKAVLLFPGQGSQQLGMGCTEATLNPKAMALFTKASTILGYNLLELCKSGPMERLSRTDVCQPAMFVCDLVAVEKLRRDNAIALEACTAVAGLSLGEYAALVFAGAMSFEDALKLVVVRAEAMHQAATQYESAMVSILGLDDEQLAKVISETNAQVGAESSSLPSNKVVLCNLLAPGNRVLGGGKAALATASRIALAPPFSARAATTLNVAGAFHTDFMSSALPALERALSTTPIAMPTVNVVCNLTGTIYKSVDEIRASLLKHIVAPVQWQASVERLINDGYLKFFEVGSGSVLTGLMKHILKKFLNNKVQTFAVPITPEAIEQATRGGAS